MADIFGRKPLEFGGAFAADSANISFGSQGAGFENGVGLVTQNIQFSYQQPITRIYEVGTQKTYFIAGRPQGTASAARILGPSEVVVSFYAAFGNVCNADGNALNFSFQSGCDTDTTVNSGGFIDFYLANVVLQSIGMSVSAQDMIINEQLSFFFTTLEVLG